MAPPLGQVDEHLPVSVVVLTKNSGATIGECLRSISRSNPSEIVVIDGGSADDTLSKAKSSATKIVYDGGRGKSHARNLGAELASAEFVAYIDSDVVIPSGAFQVMINELLNSGASAVSCLVSFRSTKATSYWTWAEGTHLLVWYRSRVRDGAYLGTHCCLMRRSLVMSHKFETRYGGGMDDVDLRFRLVEEGHKLVVSSIVGLHVKNQTFQEFVHYCLQVGKVRRGYLRKYGLAYLKYFPLSAEAYWALVSGATRRFNLIPYHFVTGISQTLGFIAGL